MKLHHLLPCFWWDGNYCYCVFLQQPAYSGPWTPIAIAIQTWRSYCSQKGPSGKKPQPPTTKQPLNFPHTKLSSLLLSLSYATPGREHSAPHFIQTLFSGFPHLSFFSLTLQLSNRHSCPVFTLGTSLSTAKPCFLPETNSSSLHVFCKRSERFPNITQPCSYLPAQSPFELYLARSPFVS